MRFKRPELNDTQLFRMTDDTGIYQHALYDVPDPRHGYTSDDNARLMLVGAMGWEATGKENYLELSYLGLQFLLAAEKNGWFRNFMGWDRNFLEEYGSQDCYGRCIWCLSYLTSRPLLPEGLRLAAEDLLRRTISGIHRLDPPHSRSYAVLGLCLWNNKHYFDEIKNLLTPLADVYTKNKKEGWFWFEDELTYCSAVMPHAFLAAGEALQETSYLQIGEESLNFLLKHTIKDKQFAPIGNEKWFSKGKVPAIYDQQPVEAVCTQLACLTAYRITKRPEYLESAQCCFLWFTGNNNMKCCMIDPFTGGCRDGLRANGPNLNQGAESLLSWYGSYFSLLLQEKEDSPDEN